MKKPTVVVVEDDPADQAWILRTFRQNHVRKPVVMAGDREKALALLLGENPADGARNGGTPDLVLLDLASRGIDGLDLLRRLRADERTRRLPVVLLTASVIEEDAVRGGDLGPSRFVRKPMSFRPFLEALRDLGMCCRVLNDDHGLCGVPS